MNKKDKEEFTKMIGDGFHEVMIPALEDMEKRLKQELASKKDLEKVHRELSMDIDSLNRKFDAQQERLDRHDNRIEKLEDIHPRGKHPLAI
jgi:chromosome segregation ATPase